MLVIASVVFKAYFLREFIVFYHLIDAKQKY